jgi:hypothetical protein
LNVKAINDARLKLSRYSKTEASTLSLYAAFAGNVGFTANKAGRNRAREGITIFMLKLFENTNAGNNMVLLVTAAVLLIRIGSMG